MERFDWNKVMWDEVRVTSYPIRPPSDLHIFRILPPEPPKNLPFYRKHEKRGRKVKKY